MVCGDDLVVYIDQPVLSIPTKQLRSMVFSKVLGWEQRESVAVTPGPMADMIQLSKSKGK
jgi:hypothetical protein